MSKPLLVKSYYRSRPFDAVKVVKTAQLEEEVYGRFDRECVLAVDIALAATDFSEVSSVA